MSQEFVAIAEFLPLAVIAFLEPDDTRTGRKVLRRFELIGSQVENMPVRVDADARLVGHPRRNCCAERASQRVLKEFRIQSLADIVDRNEGPARGSFDIDQLATVLRR